MSHCIDTGLVYLDWIRRFIPAFLQARTASAARVGAGGTAILAVMACDSMPALLGSMHALRVAE